MFAFSEPLLGKKRIFITMFSNMLFFSSSLIPFASSFSSFASGTTFCLMLQGTEDQKIVFTRLHSSSKHHVSSRSNPSVISSSVQWPDLRLVDGDIPSQGRLQIRFRERWHSVCTNFKNWTEADLNVACKELGFSEGSWLKWFDRNNDSRQFMLESPDCNGQETSIRQCKNWATKRVGSGICDYHADLGIKCSNYLNPVPEYWAGIRFLNADYETVFVAGFDERLRRKVSKSFLENVAINYAGVDIGGASVSALFSTGVAPVMNRLEIKWSAFTGLNLTHPSDQVFIEDSNFSENRGNGIFVNTSYNNVILKGIRVRNNGADGIRFINYDDLRSGDSFCQFASLGPYQIYPIYLFNQQSKYFFRNCCQELSLPAKSKAKLTAHFPYLMAEDPIGGYVRIYDEYSEKRIIEFPVQNNTRPSSFTSTSNKMKICYSTASFNKVFFNLIVTADHHRAYDLNITDSEIKKNNGRGVWIEGQKVGTVINRTLISESSYIAGLHISSGAGDVIINSSTISDNDGDGVNLFLPGGYKHVDRTVIRNNNNRGIAILFNESSEYLSFNNLNYITHSNIEDNAGYGLFMGNSCLSNSFWNISMNQFLSNRGDSLVYQSCWDPSSSKQTTLLVTHNQFRKNKRIAINISPAFHLNSSLIEHNLFESNKKGAIYVNNFDFVSNHFRYDEAGVHLFINDNYFTNNTGTFVANLGLNEFSSKQSIHFFKNVLKNNLINEPYPNLNPRSRVAAVVVISSSNCFINRNNFINPLSGYELGSHLENHAKVINASFNYFGNLTTSVIYKKIFDRKNRYNLALIQFMRYRLREHFFEISEFLSPEQVEESKKYDPFLTGNVIGGELYANEYNLPSGTYHVKEDIFVRPGSKLILNKKTILKFDKSIGMMVQGSLEFINSAQEPIIFTSLNLPSTAPVFKNKQSRTLSNLLPSIPPTTVSNAVRSKLSKRSMLSISKVSLSNGTEGLVEVVIDGVRGSVCSYGFDIIDASVVCQQLGMVLNSRDWLLEKSELKNAPRLKVLLSNVKCTKFDFDLNSCEAEVRSEFENSCLSEVGIRCYPPSWSGIRFGISASPTEIHHLRVEGAGLYDYTINTFKPALQIDFNRHRLFNVKIYDNSDTGIGIMWNDVFNSQYRREIFSSNIHSNSFNGITSHSQGLSVISCNLHKNKGSGFHYEPMFTKWEQFDLKSWISSNDANSVRVLPSSLPSNNTIYLNPKHDHWYLMIEKNVPSHTRFSFTVETEATYSIGIMVLNPISDQFTDNLTMFQKNRPELPIIDLKRNLSLFPIWKYSYKLSFAYFGGSNPKGDIVLYISVKKIDCESLTIADQERKVNQDIKTTLIQQNIMKENKHGFTSNHYNQDVSSDDNCYHRHANETFIIEGNHFDSNFGDSFFVNSPLYEPYEWSLTEINYTLINNRFLNNFKGITQINRDISNSNNLFHWTINGTKFESNHGGGVSIRLPYVWQFNENFTHSISIHNNSFFNNDNFEFLIDGHFAKMIMTKNNFLSNHCKYGLVTIAGVEKHMSITDNHIERNYCNYMVEFYLQSHADKFGSVEANFHRNQIIENKGLIQKRAIDQYNPTNYTIAIRGVQSINVTRNLLRNPDIQYELLAGVLTGSLQNKINVAQNWWNTINTTIIQQRIFDFDDWNCYATAQFSPILATESIFATQIKVDLKEEPFNLNEPFGGRVHHSMVLKKRSKPYVIKTDLTIEPNATLIIEPGAILEFYPSVGILVLGNLHAVGSRDEMITMRPAHVDHKQAAAHFFKSKRAISYQEDIRICKSELCDEWYKKKTNDGFLEVYNRNTLQWVPICDKRFTERNAQVVCHQLGFSKLNVHVKRGRRLDMGQTRISRVGHWPEPLICTGNEEKLEDCEKDLNVNTNVTYFCDHQSEDFIYIFCGPETEDEIMYWGGIRFAISGFERNSSMRFPAPFKTYQAPRSRLHYVHISKAGILHGEKNAAIQIIQRVVSIEYVKVTQSAHHAIESIAPHRQLIFHKLDIRDNLGLGLNYLLLDGAWTDESWLPFRPLKESTLPYNVFSMVNICDINKTLVVKQRILLYYKYDNKAVDCVKIIKSTLRSKKVSFRFLQFNLFNSSGLSAQPDFIKLYDGDIFNSTTKMIAEFGVTGSHQFEDQFINYKSSQGSLSVTLHASGASGIYGFIAEVVTSPVSLYNKRELSFNLTHSQIVKNTWGALVYKTANEISPALSIQRVNFASNCLPIYGNFTTCESAVLLELQNTFYLYFLNNMLQDNEGGLVIKAFSRTMYGALQGYVNNNLFINNRKGEVFKLHAPEAGIYHTFDVHLNYFNNNTSPFTNNIVISQVLCRFTKNTIARNLGLHQLESIGREQYFSRQWIENNWFYNNIATDLKQKSTIYANNLANYYFENYFANPENNFEISTPNATKFDSPKVEISASYNWWGFNNTGAISSRILDATDNFDLISVNFVPFLESNSTVLSGICSGGWQKIDDTCFLYYGAYMTYFEAKQFCESQNSTMPVIKANIRELNDYLSQAQDHFDPRFHSVWVQSFRFLEHECTAISDRTIKRFPCETRLPFLCERDLDTSVIISHWYREPLGLAALVISTVTAVLTCLFVMCWTCKSRERHKEKLERRNSIRASIRSNRSLASSGSLNEIAYKRQIEKAIIMARQNQQPPVASSPNIIANTNFKTKNGSLESFEKHPSHFNDSSGVEDLDSQHFNAAASHQKVYRELEDRFAKDAQLENANVALLIRPTFDLTYQNEGFKETSSVSRGSIEFQHSQESLPFRSISPHHHHYEVSPTPPRLSNKQYPTDNYNTRSQLSISGHVSDTTEASERHYLETSLDNDNNYDYFDCHSNRYSPTTTLSVYSNDMRNSQTISTTASTTRSRPTLETAM